MTFRMRRRHRLLRIQQEKDFVLPWNFEGRPRKLDEAWDGDYKRGLKQQNDLLIEL